MYKSRLVLIKFICMCVHLLKLKGAYLHRYRGIKCFFLKSIRYGRSPCGPFCVARPPHGREYSSSHATPLRSALAPFDPPTLCEYIAHNMNVRQNECFTTIEKRYFLKIYFKFKFSGSFKISYK